MRLQSRGGGIWESGGASQSMSKRLFVGNVAWEVTEHELRDALALVGGVEVVDIPKTPDGKGKGFGFVEMMTEEDAAAAVEKMHGEYVRGRKLRVEIAKPRENRNRERAGHARPGGRRWER